MRTFLLVYFVVIANQDCWDSHYAIRWNWWEHLHSHRLVVFDYSDDGGDVGDELRIDPSYDLATNTKWTHQRLPQM